MKKRILTAILSSMMIFALAGCQTKDKDKGTDEDKVMKVGMVTDSGTIDDKSFNQGTWEGIQRAEGELDIAKNYLKPAGETEADYLKEIQNLYDTGYKFIITPGFKFEQAIFTAQDKYKDAKFVLIDGSPNNGDYEGDFQAKVGDNTVAIFYAEHESGFLAGVATALELKEGKLGFIGGMKIPAVQKFNWGFQQGMNYANENLGTAVTMAKEDVVYEGTFNNTAGGQQLAATMYDRDVKAIFTAAGGVGAGAISEAKTRAIKGEDIWIVGVDVDQYEHGKMDNGKSVILTSAMKQIGKSAFDMISAELDSNFQGGETLIFNAQNDGIGIPDENPNLSKETTDKVEEIFQKIKSGEITVSDKADGLIEP